MAIENKWKGSSQDESSSAFDSIESQILEAEEETAHLGVRSDWTMQRKMGVAMGIVGAILVVVGIAPMVLDGDTDDLKGSLSESQEEAPDPLMALFGGAASDTQKDTSGATEPDDSLFLQEEDVSVETTPLPVETVSFGGADTTSIEMEAQPKTVNVVMPNTAGDGQFADMNLGGGVDTASSSSSSSDTSITSEVDRMLSGQNDVTNPSANTVSLSNSNTGKTDTLGAEFMTENPNAVAQQNAGNQLSRSDTFHGAAGLQNTAVKNTQLANSGPADMALVMFLVSLFVVGGLRYRKELFA